MDDNIFGYDNVDKQGAGVYSNASTPSNLHQSSTSSQMSDVDSDSENHSISLLSSILAELSEIKRCICPRPYIPPPMPDNARNMYTGGSSRKRKSRRKKHHKKRKTRIRRKYKKGKTRRRKTRRRRKYKKGKTRRRKTHRKGTRKR